MKLSIIALIIIIGYWFMDAFNTELELYLLLTQMIFIPILAIYFYRYKKGLEVKTVNKVFRWFSWFLIIVTIIMLIIELYLYYSEWWSAIGFVAIIILLGVLLKLNTLLLPKQDRHELKIISAIRNNKEATIAVVAVILVLAFALSIWINNEIWVNRMVEWSLDTDYAELIPQSTIDGYYNMAMKKIALSSSVILASAYLLIYSLKKK